MAFTTRPPPFTRCYGTTSVADFGSCQQGDQNGFYGNVTNINYYGPPPHPRTIPTRPPAANTRAQQQQWQPATGIRPASTPAPATTFQNTAANNTARPVPTTRPGIANTTLSTPAALSQLRPPPTNAGPGISLRASKSTPQLQTAKPLSSTSVPAPIPFNISQRPPQSNIRHKQNSEFQPTSAQRPQQRNNSIVSASNHEPQKPEKGSKSPLAGSLLTLISSVLSSTKDMRGLRK